ncbi:hypothetical protein IWX47DRAFT_227796 [Phyllosticta citricarpa]
MRRTTTESRGACVCGCGLAFRERRGTQAGLVECFAGGCRCRSSGTPSMVVRGVYFFPFLFLVRCLLSFAFVRVRVCVRVCVVFSVVLCLLGKFRRCGVCVCVCLWRVRACVRSWRE